MVNDENTGARKEITFRVTKETFEAFRAATFQRRVTKQSAMLAAVEAWLSGSDSLSTPNVPQVHAVENLSEKERDLVDKLLYVLRSGSKDVIRAVTENINVFQEFCRIRSATTESKGQADDEQARGAKPGKARQAHRA